MTMEDLECFVRVIGNHPIARMKSDYLERTPHMEALIERVIDFDALEKINRDAMCVQNNPEVDPDVKKLRSMDEAAFRAGEDADVLDKDKSVNRFASIDVLEGILEQDEACV